MLSCFAILWVRVSSFLNRSLFVLVMLNLHGSARRWGTFLSFARVWSCFRFGVFEVYSWMGLASYDWSYKVNRLNDYFNLKVDVNIYIGESIFKERFWVVLSCKFVLLVVCNRRSNNVSLTLVSLCFFSSVCVCVEKPYQLKISLNLWTEQPKQQNR